MTPDLRLDNVTVQRQPAAMRRPPIQVAAPALYSAGAALNEQHRYVEYRGEFATLTGLECAVLATLWRQRGQDASYAELGRVGQCSFPSLKVVVVRLRAKLERLGLSGVIGNVRGAGYVLRLPDGAATH